MEKRNRISSLVLLVLSFLLCEETYRLRLGIGALHEPGPGFLPFWTGVLMGFLSLLGYLKALRTKGPDIGPWYSREKWRKVLLILAILVAYAFGLEWVGFVVSTFLLLLVLFKVENQRWWLAVGGSLAVAIASYGIFDGWLMLQLPKGVWGF